VEGVKNKSKRSNYLIDKKFQYGLISTFLISVIAALVVFTVGFSLYFWFSTMAGDNLFKEFITIEKQVTEEREVVENGELRTETYTTTKTIPGLKRWEIVIPPLLLNNLVILIIIVIVGFFYSHRIAGPAFRMMVDIQRTLDGEKGIRVHLRKKDKLGDLADKVNLLLEKLEESRK